MDFLFPFFSSVLPNCQFQAHIHNIVQLKKDFGFGNFSVLLAHTRKAQYTIHQNCACTVCVHTSRRHHCRRLNNNMAILALMAGEFD